MNYDPYFDAYICTKCSKMEKIKNRDHFLQQNQKFQTMKQIYAISKVI